MLTNRVKYVGFQLTLLEIHRANALEVGRVGVGLLGRILQQPVPFGVGDLRHARSDELAERLAVLYRRRGGGFIIGENIFANVAAILCHPQIDIPEDRGIDHQPGVVGDGARRSPEREPGEGRAYRENEQNDGEAGRNLGADGAVGDE